MVRRAPILALLSLGCASRGGDPQDGQHSTDEAPTASAPPPTDSGAPGDDSPSLKIRGFTYSYSIVDEPWGTTYVSHIAIDVSNITDRNVLTIDCPTCRTPHEEHLSFDAQPYWPPLDCPTSPDGLCVFFALEYIADPATTSTWFTDSTWPGWGLVSGDAIFIPPPGNTPATLTIGVSSPLGQDCWSLGLDPETYGADCSRIEQFEDYPLPDQWVYGYGE